MLQNECRLPVEACDVPVGYPIRIAWSGILVDDPGNIEDIEVRTLECLEAIFQARAEVVEAEANEILGVTSLREYFRKQFFQEHLKNFSKSRRQAPVYWPLSSPKGLYLIYTGSRASLARLQRLNEHKMRAARPVSGFRFWPGKNNTVGWKILGIDAVNIRSNSNLVTGIGIYAGKPCAWIGHPVGHGDKDSRGMADFKGDKKEPVHIIIPGRLQKLKALIFRGNVDA